MLMSKLLSASAAVEPTYIEDVFSTWLYRGNGNSQTISNGLKVSGANVGALTYSNTLDGTEIEVDSQGNYYRASSGSLIKNSPTGTFLWGKTLETSRFYTNVAVDSEDNVIVSQVNLSSSLLEVYKFNGSTGAIIWKKIYTNVVGGAAIACFGTRIFLAGEATSSRGFVLEISSSTGAVITGVSQTATYGSRNYHLAVDAANSLLYVCGASQQVQATPRGLVLKYNINGTLSRVAAFAEYFSSDTYFRSIAVDSSGNVYAAGETANVQNNVVIKLNSSLVTQWKKFFSADLNSARKASLAVSETGNVLARLGVVNNGTQVVSFNSSTGAVIKNSGFSGDPGTYVGDRNMIYRGGNFIIPTSNSQAYIVPNASATQDLSVSQIVNNAADLAGVAGSAPTEGSNIVTLSGDNTFTPVDTASSSITFLTTTPYEGKGGLVWIKSRATGTAHFLFDTNRGSLNEINSNTTDAQTALANSLTGFTNTGFSLGSDAAQWGVNVNATNYASWTFCQAPRFFDVVTYTGTGANRTIAHDLGVVPGCIIVKRTDTTGDWQVYHRSNANTEYMVLNSTAAKTTGTTRWNSTTPTSSVFSLGTDATVNASGGTYVAYLFAHDPLGPSGDGSDGLIACGSVTGVPGGLATVDLGWEPQWLMIKPNVAGEYWYMTDNMRGLPASTSSPNYLQAQASNTETVGGVPDGITSRGFTLFNRAASSFLYIAIRRGPMREPTSGYEVFGAAYGDGGYAGAFGVEWALGLGYPPDLFIGDRQVSSGNFHVSSRLTGSSSYLQTNTTSSQSTTTTDGYKHLYDNQVGIASDTARNSGSYFGWLFRRAPGFFDVVAYRGTGSTGTKNHNLGVVPEMMIFKNRNDTDPWFVYHQATGNTGYTPLNSNSGFLPASLAFNNTSPTATVFTVGSTLNFSSSFNYTAYLFASLPGISKVGSYTGNGSSQTINCGFTTGARFILIKRTDSTGDWYVWDTARGIVAGNDPRLSLNSTAAQVTTDDTIDPASSGFIVNQDAATNVNVNAATYIYLAIA